MNQYLKADVENLKRQISSLILQFPELADDPDFAAEVFDAETDLNSLLARLVDYANDAGSMADAVEERIDGLAIRYRRVANKRDAMRSLIQHVMEAANLAKVTLPEATLSIRHIAPAPMIADADALPADCVVLVRKPIMAAIKAAIDEGRDVPGVVLSNGKNSLTIRTK